MKSLLGKFILLSASLSAMFSSIVPCQAQIEGREKWESGFRESVNSAWYLPDAPQNELSELKSRWENIEKELKSTSNEFAGTYLRYGAMRSGILRWSPDNGFVYIYVYEWYSVLNFSYGKVTVTPSEVIFTVEREQKLKNVDDTPHLTPQNWIPATWKRTNYLISSTEVSDFGNYTAGFGQFNDFNGPCCEFSPFFARVSANRAPAFSDKPILPNKYQRFIKQPINAKITFIGHKRFVKNYGLEGSLYGQLFMKASLTPIRISAGKSQGVKQNMLFRLINNPDQQYLKITSVKLNYSEGIIIRDIDDEGRELYLDASNSKKGEYKKKPFPLIRIGTKVTTCPR